jgi:hypothetical protein
MKRTILAVATVLFASTAAMADPQPGKLSGSISGGADFPVGGKVHKGASANVPNLGALNPALAGTPATLNIEPRKQKDVYDTAWTIGGELAYGLSENGEVLGQVRYSRAKSNRIQVGSAAAGAPVNASLPIFGTFGKAKSFSTEIGYRHYLGSAGGIRPYAAAKIGAARTNRVNATFEIPAANITIANAPFYRKSWVFSAGGDAGISVPVSPNFSLQAETGIRYTGAPRDNDTALSGLGLAGINDTGKRWSVPVTVRAKVGF